MALAKASYTDPANFRWVGKCSPTVCAVGERAPMSVNSLDCWHIWQQVSTELIQRKEQTSLISYFRELLNF